jgi:glucoamylase
MGAAAAALSIPLLSVASAIARATGCSPQSFLFGVCAPGGAAAVCSVDPGTVPKAVDVITSAGVSQATELDPTLRPVVIQPVTVP